jgi:hypothetical protein
MTHSRRRAGLGYLIPLVVLLLTGVLVFLGATSLSTSGAARATARVTDVRLVVDACRSALAGATPASRASIAGEGTAADGAVRWRRELAPPFQRPLPASVLPVPRRLLERFETDMEVEVSDVRAAVVQWWEASGGEAPQPAQGVLELTVTASIDRPLYSVNRTMIQRRVFYAEGGEVVLSTLPLATVMQP